VPANVSCDPQLPSLGSDLSRGRGGPKKTSNEGNVSTHQEKIRWVGGCDAAYARKTGQLFAAVVVLDIETMETIESVLSKGKEHYPYIPGLLSFRELPVILKALGKIHHVPEVFILDGQGIAHPQGLGLASHLGVLIDLPTVGCAKSKLVGDYRPFPREKGAYEYLYYKRKKVGAVVCTKDRVNPLYVSPGHRIDILSSVRLICRCCAGFRIPEPIRRAHTLATLTRDREARD
jgi:deoxyribonuclease V